MARPRPGASTSTPAGRPEGSWLDVARAPWLLRAAYPALRARIRFVDHHRTHAALSFFGSAFERAAILVVDGGGEEASTTLAMGEGTSIRVLDRVAWPNSLGHFYSAMTGYLVFQMLDGEYKIMGIT
jgi:carbamoyltransferase